MKLQFNKTSLLITVLLFITELLIEKTNGFIRYTFGDFLVVILMYYFFKTFLKITINRLCYIVLTIALTVEILQATPFLRWINLGNNQIARIVFGTTFAFTDLVAYTFGAITVYFIEKLRFSSDFT